MVPIGVWQVCEIWVCIPQVSINKVGSFRRCSTTTLRKKADAAALQQRQCCAQWVDSGRNHTWPYWATGLSTTTSQKGDWQENNRSNCHRELKSWMPIDLLFQHRVKSNAGEWSGKKSFLGVKIQIPEPKEELKNSYLILISWELKTFKWYLWL